MSFLSIFRAAMVASGLIAFAAPLLAQPVASDITGDWRPQGDDTADPVLMQLDCKSGDPDCQEEHGTFEPDLFLRVLLDETNGVLTMYSSSGLIADVAPRKGKPQVFDVTHPKGQAQIVFDSPACIDIDPCFEVSLSSNEMVLPNDVYVNVVELEADPGMTMSIKDRFGAVPPNMDLAGHCYDITKMGVDSFTNSQGCRHQIFMKFGQMDEKDYTITSLGDEKMVAIPFGWKYLPISKTYGANTARILESASDIIESHQRSIGVSLSVGLGPVSLSYSHNETTKKRTEDMYERSLTYSEYHYLKTDFALVLDKVNARFAPEFEDAILAASRTPDGSPQRENALARIIKQFGTHYAHATTMGERGKLVSTITKENVMKLHEEGVEISNAVSFGVSSGEASAKIGVNSGSSDDENTKMSSTLGEDYGKYVCEGGVSCNGTNPSGNTSVPVLLDLRPLSELLGPPFFQEIKEDLPALQEAFRKAIVDYAYGGPENDTNPSARFLRVSHVKPLCQVEGLLGLSPQNSVDCKIQGVTLKTDATTMTFTDGPPNTILTASGPEIVVGAESGATLHAAAMVVWTKADCFLDAHKKDDRTEMTPISVTGQAAIPNPFPSGTSDIVIYMPDETCQEVKGFDDSIFGKASLVVSVDRVTAADLLTR
jgi:hypothetical protein